VPQETRRPGAEAFDAGLGLPAAARRAAQVTAAACAELGPAVALEAGWAAAAATAAVKEPLALTAIARHLRATGVAPLGVALRLPGEPALTGASPTRRAAVAVHALVALCGAGRAWALTCTANGPSWPIATASALDGRGAAGAPPGVRLLLDGTAPAAAPGGIAEVPGGRMRLHWTARPEAAKPVALAARRFAAALATPDPVLVPAPPGEAEARLARVGLDLHDGPLQDLALLRTWVARAEEAAARPREDPEAAAALARLADAVAVLGGLEGELRDLACSLDADGGPLRPLHAALRGAFRAFELRAPGELDAEVGPGVDELSDAHQVAVLRVVEAALGNARLHSDAHSVVVRVHRTAAGVEVLVRDDGRGFRVEDAMVTARASGRMGLLGMAGRARALGGECTVTSAEGAGTEVRLVLPRSYSAASTAAGIPARIANAAAPVRLETSSFR
jgi:signal transduction histidine kinase